MKSGFWGSKCHFQNRVKCYSRRVFLKIIFFSKFIGLLYRCFITMIGTILLYQSKVMAFIIGYNEFFKKNSKLLQE
jgi:hypothetical protein